MAFDSLLPVEALRFLVEFTQETDLQHARLRQLRRLDRDVQRFINRNAPRGLQFNNKRPNWRTLETLRERASRMLNGFAETGLATAGELKLTLVAHRDVEGVRQQVLGDPESRFAFQIFQVLIAVEPDVLRKCPACGRIFVATGKKKNCSERCAQRLYMREWRKK